MYKKSAGDDKTSTSHILLYSNMRLHIQILSLLYERIRPAQAIKSRRCPSLPTPSYQTADTSCKEQRTVS